jgi:integrase
MRRGGKRIRERYLKTKAEAETLAAAWGADTANTGAQAAAEITDGDKRVLMEWREKLARYGKTPADAVDHFLAHLKRCQVSITIADLSDKYQTLKGREKASRRYQDDLRSRLGIFCADFGDRTAADVTTDEISGWLSGLDAAPVTVANYRRILSVLFNYAVSLKACADNPVDAAMKPKVKEAVANPLPVSDVSAILRSASTRPEILPALAIGFFGGVRAAEIQRLDWRNVNFETGFVEITAATAKKASRRLVQIRPVLRAWLEPQRKLAGKIWEGTADQYYDGLESIRSAAGLTEWPHNALRDSFISYGLAKEQNANAIALEAGNSVEVIMERYREVVLPTEASAYWSLTPSVVSSASNIVQMHKAGKVA